jgi:hypothetical protein
LKLDIPEARRAGGSKRLWIIDRGGYMLIGQKIYRKDEVEPLNHPKPKYQKRRESSIYEETLGNKSRALRKLKWDFYFEN